MTVEVTGPIDWALVETALVNWATGVVPEFSAAIFAQQNAPQPERPYCVFTYESVEQKGDDDVRREFNAATGKDDMFIAGQRVVELGVDIIAASSSFVVDPNTFAMPLASRLIASLALEDVLIPFREVDVAVANTGNVDNLTALEGAEWVSRARFTLRMNVAANVSFPNRQSDIIDSVGAEGPINLTTPPNATQNIDGNNP